MRTGILIPFRGTIKDKSRLRKDINNEFVNDLLYKMTENAIKIASEISYNTTIYLLTKNAEIQFSGQYEVIEDLGLDMNNSINEAINHIKEEIIMILMADLPLIRKKILEEIIKQTLETERILIAPSPDLGTSIICYPKNTKFPFLFGEKSSEKFKNFFENNNLKYLLLDFNESFRDIDTFKDLMKFKEFNQVPQWFKDILEGLKDERKNKTYSENSRKA